ncbi:MAG TPA: hypothetical protein VFT79_13485 [Solirubrobacterales bacterium]|nr:hypothetical protein [Solirubrobacterales bacterium]
MISATDVYEVLGLPRGLRTHMARTVAVVKVIGHGGATPVSAVTDDVALAMALHDVGNAVKPVGDGALLNEPADQLDRWRLYASFAQARYGEDEHQATKTILGDLGIRQPLIDLIQRKSSHNLLSILEVGDPAELLAIYADMRVSPSGFVSIVERHEDAQARYSGDANRKGLGGDVTLAHLRQLEEEVAERFEFDPAGLEAPTVDARLVECLSMDLADAFR